MARGDDPNLYVGTLALALLAALPACAGAYRTSRIEALATDQETGTAYFVEVRRGREV